MCPVMCTVPAEPPAEPLTPYERRVMAHVARRAGVRGEVPAPALSDGFEDGQAAFMKAFREEVDADVVQRGLTRPRLSRRRIGLLCLALLVPAGALGLALAVARQPYPAAAAGGAWFVLVLVTGGVGDSRRPSAAGHAVLDRWHAAADAARRGGVSLGGADARLQAYAAALGRAPGVGLRRAEEERGVVQLPGRLAAAAGRDAHLALAAGRPDRRPDLAGAPAGAPVRRVRRPGDPADVHRERRGPGRVPRGGRRRDAAHGVGPQGGGRIVAADAPGTFVHARVNLHNREVSIHPVEPPAVARPLANPGVPFDPRSGGG
jgi:hypothetical protein